MFDNHESIEWLLSYGFLFNFVMLHILCIYIPNVYNNQHNIPHVVKYMYELYYTYFKMFWSLENHLQGVYKTMGSGVSRIYTCIQTNKQTPQTRVLLQKLRGHPSVKTQSAFYVTYRFITTFTTAYHLSPS